MPNKEVGTCVKREDRQVKVIGVATDLDEL